MKGAPHLTEKLGDEGLKSVLDAQTDGKQKEMIKIMSSQYSQNQHRSKPIYWETKKPPT